MKRVMTLILIMLFASAGIVSADDYMSKKTGDLTVTASFDNRPPVIGINNLLITIIDNAGEPVRHAKVVLKYYMTAQEQSSQKPLEKKATATESETLYHAILDLDMKGSWYVDVNIARNGMKSSVTFQVHVE